MRPQPPPDTNQAENWGVLKKLLPYLSEYKARVMLALMFLVGAKLATTGMPFLIKGIVDQLGATGKDAWSGQWKGDF